MRKTTIASIIAIFLCFMVGYVAYEVAFLTQTWITQQFSDCSRSRTSRCAETPDAPLAESDRR